VKSNPYNLVVRTLIDRRGSAKNSYENPFDEPFEVDQVADTAVEECYPIGNKKWSADRLFRWANLNASFQFLSRWRSLDSLNPVLTHIGEVYCPEYTYRQSLMNHPSN
jgi:hypothetical protein